MKKIFCLVGKTGSGKSTFLDQILNNVVDLQHKRQDSDKNFLTKLIYCTTRSPRVCEKDGIDYYFKSEDDFKQTDPENIVESRMYNMITGPVYYYTTKNCLSGHNNFICAASIEQVANYIDKSNYNDLGNTDILTYIIYIHCDLKIRLERVLNNRCKTDNDILELCRRVVQEKKDYEEPNIMQTLKKVPDKYRLDINNNRDKNWLIGGIESPISTWIIDRL